MHRNRWYKCLIKTHLGEVNRFTTDCLFSNQDRFPHQNGIIPHEKIFTSIFVNSNFMHTTASSVVDPTYFPARVVPIPSA